MLEKPSATYMQLTSVVTTSQQMQAFPPIQTPHISSQKDSVVSIGGPNPEFDYSLEHLYSSPAPGDDSLSTPPPTNILTTLKPLLNVIDKTALNTPSSSLSPITKGMLPHVTRPCPHIIVNSQAEASTALVSQVKLGGFSSEVATKTIGTTVSQVGSGCIAKTFLKETTVKSVIVYSLSVGSPHNQEQEAFGSKPSTTTFGGNSDNPIILGDALRYHDLS
ncbi:hypothetical protein Hanom_Chr17g01576061 [Helianthus anomalus]